MRGVGLRSYSFFLIMKTIKEFKYKGLPVVLEIAEINDKFYFTCSSYSLRSEHNPKHVNGGWETPDMAIDKIKIVIDEFLKNIPQNYEELAEAIHATLVWDSHEDCHIEPHLLRIIIVNFSLVKH